MDVKSPAVPLTVVPGAAPEVPKVCATGPLLKVNHAADPKVQYWGAALYTPWSLATRIAYEAVPYGKAVAAVGTLCRMPS